VSLPLIIVALFSINRTEELYSLHRRDFDGMASRPSQASPRFSETPSPHWVVAVTATCGDLQPQHASGGMAGITYITRFIGIHSRSAETPIVH